MKSAAKQPTKPRPLFTSMKNGMQQMVDAVVAQIDIANVRQHLRVGLYARRAGVVRALMAALPTSMV